MIGWANRPVRCKVVSSLISQKKTPSRFLEHAAAGTIPGRGGWANGLPPVGVEGVFMSTRPYGEEEGGGVLVSPTRDERDRAESGSSGVGRAGGGSGALMPRFSPVSDTFIKKPLW